MKTHVHPKQVVSRMFSFLWWTPTAKIVCGGCSKPFKSKILHSNKQDHYCPNCGSCNRFRIEWG